MVFVFPEVSVGFLWICQFEQLKKTRRLTLCSMYDFSSTSVWKLSEPQFTLYTVNNSTIYFSTEILFAPPHIYALPTSPAFYLYFKRTSGLTHLFNYFYLSPRSSYQDAVLPLKSWPSSIVLFYMCSIYSLFLFGTYGPMTGQTDKLSFGNVTVSLKENWNWFSVFHFSSFFLYICTCNTRDKCTLQDVLYEGNVWREQLLVGKWGLTIE